MSRGGYLFEGLKIYISTFCVFADDFQGLPKAFCYCIQLLTFYLLLGNYFLTFTETLLRIPLSVIGRCSLVPTSNCLQGKCARINMQQAASGKILQNHRWLPVSILSVKIADLGLCSWLLEGFSK